MIFTQFSRGRDWLSWAVLAGLLAICGTAMRDVAMRPVRTVDRLGHADLLDWLSGRDLRGEFTTTKLRLARRLAEDLRQGYDWQQDLAALDRPRRELCAANARELVRVWLLERAERYAALTEPDRTAFVDEQLDDVLYWPVWQRRGSRDLAGLMPRNPALAVEQLDAWTGELQEHDRQRIHQFTGALYLRWLQRGIQFLPSGV
ncbi:MAG TPA: hypothetical protein VFI31_23555 [Pirellulales bacterium]|nr:hypothetical protein [Pirellulales bacterium]